MDATRIHLFVTHLPVFGLLLGFLALVYGAIRRDKQVKIISYLIILVAVAGGVIAFQTGPFAEDSVEKLAGVSKDAIEEHEESAEWAIPFFYGLAVLSCAAIYFQGKESKFARPLLFAILFLSLFTFFIAARTASLGGKIRHSEIVGENNSEVENH